MLREKKSWRVWSLFLVTVLSVSVRAAVPKALVPVLDDQTVMVIHLNVTTAEIDALADEILDMIQTHVGDAGLTAFKGDVDEMRSRFNQQLLTLQQNGGQEAYIVCSQCDFPVPFIAIPVKSGSQVEKLIEHLKDFTGTGVELLSSDLIVAGEPQTLARLKQLSPQSYIPIMPAFASAGSADLEVMLAPNADQRRIFTEMLPEVPLASGRIPVQSLIDNLQWGLIQVNTPPELSLRVTLESQDSTQAKVLQEAIKESYATIAQHSKVKSLMPRAQEILAELIPGQDKNRLALSVDRSKADHLMKDFVAPSLLSVRKIAMRHKCASKLNGLAKAMLIYGNDYEDELPLKWDDLKLVEVTDEWMTCPMVKTKGSYIYRGAGLSFKDPLYMVIIHDKKGNHSDGRNVVFLDSHIEWVTEDRFQELIQADNKWRRENDLPEIPPQ